MKRLLLFALLACFAGAVLAQELKPADIDGEWAFKMDTPNGEVNWRLVLKMEDGRISGAIYASPERKLDILNGKAKGNEVTWTIKRDRQSGGVMVYEMTAKVEGGKMNGTTVADMDGQKVEQPWSAEKKQ